MQNSNSIEKKKVILLPRSNSFATFYNIMVQILIDTKEDNIFLIDSQILASPYDVPVSYTLDKKKSLDEYKRRLKILVEQCQKIKDETITKQELDIVINKLPYYVFAEMMFSFYIRDKDKCNSIVTKFFQEEMMEDLIDMIKPMNKSLFYYLKQYYSAVEDLKIQYDIVENTVIKFEEDLDENKCNRIVDYIYANINKGDKDTMLAVVDQDSYHYIYQRISKYKDIDCYTLHFVDGDDNSKIKKIQKDNKSDFIKYFYQNGKLELENKVSILEIINKMTLSNYISFQVPESLGAVMQQSLDLIVTSPQNGQCTVYIPQSSTKIESLSQQKIQSIEHFESQKNFFSDQRLPSLETLATIERDLIGDNEKDFKENNSNIRNVSNRWINCISAQTSYDGEEISKHQKSRDLSI